VVFDLALREGKPRRTKKASLTLLIAFVKLIDSAARFGALLVAGVKRVTLVANFDAVRIPFFG